MGEASIPSPSPQFFSSAARLEEFVGQLSTQTLLDERINGVMALVSLMKFNFTNTKPEGVHLVGFASDKLTLYILANHARCPKSCCFTSQLYNT